MSVLCPSPLVFRTVVNQEFSWTQLCRRARLLPVTPKGPRVPSTTSLTTPSPPPSQNPLLPPAPVCTQHNSTARSDPSREVLGCLLWLEASQAKLWAPPQARSLGRGFKPLLLPGADPKTFPYPQS